jgi:hypothetical protein
MMDYETAYHFVNLAVVPAWLLLVFAPGSKLTRTLVHSGLYPALYASLYIVLLGRAMIFGVGAEDGDMSSLSGVMAFFSHPNGLLIGWVHYLAFDLFIGAWIARDGVRQAIAHWKLVPCLVLTFMLGPVGLFLYLVLRHFGGKQAVPETS